MSERTKENRDGHLEALVQLLSADGPIPKPARLCLLPVAFLVICLSWLKHTLSPRTWRNVTAAAIIVSIMRLGWAVPGVRRTVKRHWHRLISGAPKSEVVGNRAAPPYDHVDLRIMPLPEGYNKHLLSARVDGKPVERAYIKALDPLATSCTLRIDRRFFEEAAGSTGKTLSLRAYYDGEALQPKHNLSVAARPKIVAKFDSDDRFIEILDNARIPQALRDMLHTADKQLMRSSSPPLWMGPFDRLTVSLPVETQRRPADFRLLLDGRPLPVHPQESLDYVIRPRNLDPASSPRHSLELVYRDRVVARRTLWRYLSVFSERNENGTRWTIAQSKSKYWRMLEPWHGIAAVSSGTTYVPPHYTALYFREFEDIIRPGYYAIWLIARDFTGGGLSLPIGCGFAAVVPAGDELRCCDLKLAQPMMGSEDDVNRLEKRLHGAVGFRRCPATKTHGPSVRVRFNSRRYRVDVGDVNTSYTIVLIVRVKRTDRESIFDLEFTVCVESKHANRVTPRLAAEIEITRFLPGYRVCPALRRWGCPAISVIALCYIHIPEGPRVHKRGGAAGRSVMKP